MEHPGLAECSPDSIMRGRVPRMADPIWLERIVIRSQFTPMIYVVDATGEDGGHRLRHA
jgi:hypothetical protein